MRAGDEAGQWWMQAKYDGGCSRCLSGGGHGQEREDGDRAGWVDRGKEAGCEGIWAGGWLQRSGWVEVDREDPDGDGEWVAAAETREMDGTS